MNELDEDDQQLTNLSVHPPNAAGEPKPVNHNPRSAGLGSSAAPLLGGPTSKPPGFQSGHPERQTAQTAGGSVSLSGDEEPHLFG